MGSGIGKRKGKVSAKRKAIAPAMAFLNLVSDGQSLASLKIPSVRRFELWDSTVPAREESRWILSLCGRDSCYPALL
jgi:hypothetical protein